MESITQANRFLQANWKELDTAFKIQSAISRDMKLYGIDTCQQKQLKSLFYQLEDIIRFIMAATADVNRNAHRTGEPLLPCVAWLPAKQLDEETGLVLPMSSQPELPEFKDKAEKCHYLKQLADQCLYETLPPTEQSDEEPLSPMDPEPQEQAEEQQAVEAPAEESVPEETLVDEQPSEETPSSESAPEAPAEQPLTPREILRRRRLQKKQTEQES